MKTLVNDEHNVFLGIEQAPPIPLYIHTQILLSNQTPQSTSYTSTVRTVHLPR